MPRPLELAARHEKMENLSSSPLRPGSEDIIRREKTPRYLSNTFLVSLVCGKEGEYYTELINILFGYHTVI